MFKIPVSITLFAVLLAAPLAAQENPASSMWRVDGADSFDALGWGVLRDFVDLNGDGVVDVVTKNSNASTNMLYKNGSVQVFSGVDGALLWRRDGTVDGELYGQSLSLTDDLDGDGVQDYFHRQPEGNYNGHTANGSVEAVSGANGSLIWNRLGWSDNELLGSAAEVMPDINGDGVPDIAIGSKGANDWGGQANGYVELVNGKLGQQWWHIAGTSDHEGLGAEIAMVDDLDGDGNPDILSANPEASTNGNWQNGFVQAMSSVNGALLWRIDGASDNSMIGQNMESVPDANGDGVADILVVNPDAFEGSWYWNGTVQMLSGVDGSIIWAAAGYYHGERLGSEYNAGWDLNGDNVNDIVVGMPDRSTGGKTVNGSLWVLDGAHGWPIWQKDGTDNYGRLGEDFWLSGDLDGDGIRDVVAAAPEASTLGLNGNGFLQAFNGQNGNTLWRLDGLGDTAHLGLRLSRPGDLDGDGVDDYVSGSEFDDSSGLVNNGSIIAINGVNGATLWSHDGEGNDIRLGANLSDMSDLDGDGVRDIVSHSNLADSNGFINNGSVRAFAGFDGSELWRLDGDSNDSRFGWVTKEAPDLDGDGHADVIVSAPYSDSGGKADNGYIMAMSAGTSATLTVDDGAGIGGIFAGQFNTWHSGGMSDGALVYFVASLHGTGQLDPGHGFTMMLASPYILLGSATADVNGNASLVVDVPAKGAGLRVWSQAVGKIGPNFKLSRMMVYDVN